DRPPGTGCAVGRREAYECEDAVPGIGPGRSHDQLARLLAARAGHVESARLQVVADMDPERRRDSDDCQCGREQPPRSAGGQGSKGGEHRSARSNMPLPRRRRPRIRPWTNRRARSAPGLLFSRDVESRLPAGTVTFLFTDVEGSTRLLRDLGDDYA